ncbi:Uncharacterised protein [Vibrio cholerae]|nr:Uncharacterised protein [Vibrio cholerae]
MGLVERLESGDRVRNAHKPSFVQSSDGRVPSFQQTSA